MPASVCSFIGGLYSTLGGEWEGFDYGKEMGGASAEWIMPQARIPKERYAALAGRFNPVKRTRHSGAIQPHRMPRRQHAAQRQADGSVRIRVPSPPQDIFVIALELAGPVETDPAITGAYHWVKDVDIRLNKEKMARQRAQGWKARK